MNTIKNIEDVRRALGELGPVIGLGVTAFPRVGVIPIIPDYKILSIKESKELESIRQVVEVISVKRDFGGRVEKLNTLALLQHKSVQKYLKDLGEKWLFVYKSSAQIEKIADSLGYKILSNKSEVRDRYENKWEFRRVAEEAGLPIPEGEQMEISDLDESKYFGLQEKFGKKLVFQVTDYAKGGGIGTFFIFDKSGFDEFHAFVGRRREAGRTLTKVNVTRFVEGESASITGCVTKFGTLTSLVQRQIVDVPEVVGYKGRNGVFCGHDWGERYNESIYQKAVKIAKDLGKHMFANGYKGIFGIDLVVNRKSGEAAIVECNSRYTGAFPTYSMLQIANGEIPMDAWHLLEHAGVDYEMDFDEVQKSYNKVKVGSQLILHNLERAWAAVRGEVKAGIYRFAGSDPVKQSPTLLDWVRPGFGLDDVKGDNEFVLTDGVPRRNLRLKPGSRLGRVLFKREVMRETQDELQEEIKQAMVEMYRRYKLEKVKREK